MIFLSIDYDEPDPRTFRAVTLRADEQKLRLEGAHEEAPYLWVIALVTGAEAGRPAQCSSAIDQYVMDGGTLPEEDGDFIPDLMERARVLYTEKHKPAVRAFLAAIGVK